MPRKRRNNANEIDEPPQKIPKQPKAPKECYINRLPNELLEKIVGYINHWHRPRLRRSCKRMRFVCDSVLMHEFHSSLHRYSCKDPNGYEYAALMAIKHSTWPYVTNGFESIFCGTILRLIWDNNIFKPSHHKLKSFLKHFYKLTNEKMRDSGSQLSRLLYSMTLMGLLRKFKNSRVVTSTVIPPNYWRIILELRGPWLGVLWSSKTATEPHERGKLLMILCEMLIADCTSTVFKKVWECDSDIFVFGIDACERAERLKNPTTVFTFKIGGPLRIVSLLRSCLEDSTVEWPSRLPRSEFVVSIDITCKETLKWGCVQVHRMEIGPFVDGDGNGELVEEREQDYLARKASGISLKTVIEIE